MAEVITTQGETLIAEKMGNEDILVIDTFILSYDPDIDPEADIDRDTGLPESDSIVYEAAVTQSGYVNPNQVVYSLFMDATVGPFQFNRMDLVASGDNNTNVAIATFPTQNKVADDPGSGIRGQSMTRNFMMVYDGAQAVTDITVEAETWQIDFMARLNDSDQLERKSTRDTYGRACFWEDGFKVIKSGDIYQLSAGTGYVEGIRGYLEDPQTITPGTLPKDVWLDVSLQGNMNGVSPLIEPVFSTSDQPDYRDSNGVDHYLVKVAEISSSAVVTDTRRAVAVVDHLLAYLESPQWNNVQGKPTTFPPSDHRHDWDELDEKPSTYPPSDHEHEWGDITNPPDSFLPGMIMMWAGTEDQIPSGWQLCDGEGTTSNGIDVPDLRDRMLMGAGNSYEVGDSGGRTSYTTSSDGWHSHSITVNSGGTHSHSVTVDRGGSHSHSITVNGRTLSTSEMPSHAHTTSNSLNYTVSRDTGDYDRYEGNRSSRVKDSTNSSGSSYSHNHSASSSYTGSHSHSASTGTASSHSHSASSNTQGSHSHTVSTLPPYYALAYIIKL